MPGDFGGIWTVYGNEAKSHDELQMQTLRDGVDNYLIFVRSHFVHTCGFQH
jgi:hypothetical protein